MHRDVIEALTDDVTSHNRAWLDVIWVVTGRPHSHTPDKPYSIDTRITMTNVTMNEKTAYDVAMDVGD